MEARDIAWITVVGSVVFSVFLWCFVLWVIAWTSGWRRLAQRYSDTSPLAWSSGGGVRFASAQMGLASYSGVLTVDATDKGVSIATIRLFRLSHPPLRIPWSEMTIQVRGGKRWKAVQLKFPDIPRVTVTLYGRAAERVLPYVQDRE